MCAAQAFGAHLTNFSQPLTHGPVLPVLALHETRQEVLSIFVDGEFQAALVFFTPSSKVTPAITSLKSSDPFNDRQLFDALSISLKTIVRHAVRLPLPFVLLCLSRTVENVDSIGFVVRMCSQCSAGKS